MQALLDLLPLVIFVVGAVAVLLQVKSFANQSKKYRIKAKQAFQEVRYNLDDSKFGLDGRTAEILRVGEQLIGTDDSVEGMVLEMHVRNGFGEYFYVNAQSTGTVFVKHITHAAAQVVLKDKYIPLPSAGG